MSRREWTATDDTVLRTHWATSTWRDLGQLLQRSRSSVFHRAHKLGLSKIPFRRWTAEEDEVIRDNHLLSLRDMARLLGRGESTVSERANKIGLPFRRRRGYRPHRDGYVYIAHRDPDGIVRRKVEHRLVMERVLGLPLKRRERIHHINFIKYDNRPENLFLCRSIAEHRTLHARTDALLSQLLQQGIVVFNRSRRTYELCATSN